MNAYLDDSTPAGWDARLARIERLARRHLAEGGDVLRISRTRNMLSVDYGTYRIVHTRANTAEAREPHGLFLQDVLTWIDD
ncbi:hypothetical protein ACIPV2_13090 [Microbacterium sp. NPDC089987]|uniref:hypothetical protein n=1 Tax=Microbacterium sp. NPDC089987 TaxID=3364202 RepID=UPI0037F977D6